MGFTLSRDEFNELRFFHGHISGVQLPVEARAAILAKHYPASTVMVVGELRYRGFDADSQSLGNLITTGKISSPANRSPSGYHLWTPAEIDSAAERLAELERFTPEAFARIHFHISAYQFEADKARAMLALTPGELDLVNARGGPDALVVTIIPSGKADVPARVVFRAPTIADETAATVERYRIDHAVNTRGAKPEPVSDKTVAQAKKKPTAKKKRK